MRIHRSFAGSVAAAATVAVVLAGPGAATAPPVGPLPPGPTSTIQTTKGQLVAMALPNRPNGRVWRVAAAINAKVIRQVSEGNVGKSVVVVYEAVGSGSATVTFALTRGETAKVYEARRYSVKVK